MTNILNTQPAPTTTTGPLRRLVRNLMRFVFVPLMVAVAIYIVATEGVDGVITLLPILGAHVGVALAIILWIRYRRRRRATERPDE
jgi:uncharacterized membrane protein YoaK (UPF0700 family)